MNGSRYASVCALIGVGRQVDPKYLVLSKKDLANRHLLFRSILITLRNFTHGEFLHVCVVVEWLNSAVSG
jgi:hypothetical protein